MPDPEVSPLNWEECKRLRILPDHINYTQNVHTLWHSNLTSENLLWESSTSLTSNKRQMQKDIHHTPFRKTSINL